jgi:hypothetical protein
MKIKLSDIVIGERQRVDLGDIEELAESIARLGQIHNIGVRAEDMQLIWGMRRYTAMKMLGWTECEATLREGLSLEQEQELELEEDVKRKDRTWQEKCLAVAKLFRIKARNARAVGETWTLQMMASFTGQSKATMSNYIYTLADALAVTPRDEALWTAGSYVEALGVLRDRRFAEANAELERRRAVNNAFAATPLVMPTELKVGGIRLPSLAEACGTVVGQPSPIQQLNPTRPALPTKVGMTHVTLRDRAQFFNKKYEHLWKQQLSFRVNPKDPTEQFIEGWWFVGGGNISDLYGSYQTEYLERIAVLFPDAVKVVHLFVGSLPPSPNYVRVGLPQGDTKPDIECDAHHLSSKLPFKPDLIYADPPYSIEDSEHYANSMVNRERVIQECALVLEPGGFLVWMDQALPLFSNNDLRLVGGISYIRSTGNRFRVVTIFQKPCLPTKSSPAPAPANSANLAEFV